MLCLKASQVSGHKGAQDDQSLESELVRRLDVVLRLRVSQDDQRPMSFRFRGHRGSLVRVSPHE